MDFSKRINFKTPQGLKIRLNHHYFFCQLVKPERYYTDEEITNNDTMYNATASIETVYLIPNMLIQFFSLFVIIFHFDVFTYCSIGIALYVFGCIWRCSKQDFLISTTLYFIATIYKALYWLCYIALVVLVFVLDCTYLIVPYIIIRLVLFVYGIFQNAVISSITKKKYGVSFNDTEMCAFVVFHLLSQSTDRISDYIQSYVSVIYQEE